MRVPKRALTLVAVVAVVAVVAMQSGCDKNRIKCAITASEKIARVADKAPVLVEQLAAEGALDRADAESITALAGDVKSSAEELGKIARAMKEDTPDNREKLRAAVQQVAASIRRLDGEGVLKVKNEQARARLRAALALAEVAAELAL